MKSFVAFTALCAIIAGASARPNLIRPRKLFFNTIFFLVMFTVLKRRYASDSNVQLRF